MRIWVRPGPKAAVYSTPADRRGPAARASLHHGSTSLSFFTDQRWHAGRRKNRGALRQPCYQHPFSQRMASRVTAP